MKTEDKKKFGELMALAAETFQKEVSKPMLRLYWTLLEKYDYPTVEQGIHHILQTRTITGTFPLPAEIIEAINSQTGILSIEEKAEVAWLALIWAMESVGRWASVQFDDLVIHDTVKALGGWIKITDAENPDWNSDKQMTWRRKDFVGLYKIMSKKQGNCLQYLIGEQEAANDGVFNDFVPKITRIGGKPGQYQIEQVDRPMQITHESDDIAKQISDICERANQ